jgi:hypothetical protein
LYVLHITRWVAKEFYGNEWISPNTQKIDLHILETSSNAPMPLLNELGDVDIDTIMPKELIHYMQFLMTDNPLEGMKRWHKLYNFWLEKGNDPFDQIRGS